MIETTFVYDAFNEDESNTIRAIVRDQSQRVSSSIAPCHDYAVVLGTYKPVQAVGSKMWLNFGEEDGPFSSIVLATLAKKHAEEQELHAHSIHGSLVGLVANICGAHIQAGAKAAEERSNGRIQ